MQIIRTILWTRPAVIAAGFVSYNWGEKVPVKFWPLENEPVVFDWPVGFIAIVFFLLGLPADLALPPRDQVAPTRRITSLESAFKSNNAPAEAAVVALTPAHETAEQPLPAYSRQQRKPMSNPVYLALDVPQLWTRRAGRKGQGAYRRDQARPRILLCPWPPRCPRDRPCIGLPVFLDLKLHDIPNTVAGAMQAIHVLEPAIVTIHASGGRR